MDWIRSEKSLGDHPKTRRAAKMLSVSMAAVVGHLHYLWWWSMQYAPDGFLGRFDNEEIADAARWDGDPDQFVAALVDCGPGDSVGFLERRDDGLWIHDWEDYAAKLIEQRTKDIERYKRWREQQAQKRKSGAAGDGGGTKTTVESPDAPPTPDVHEANPLRTGSERVPNPFATRSERETNDVTNVTNVTDVTDTGTGRARAREYQPAASGGGDQPTGQPVEEQSAAKPVELTAMPAEPTETDDQADPGEDPAMTIHHALESVAGILCPPAHQVEKVAAWLGRGMDMGAIVYACELAADRGKRRVDYLEGILRRWHAAGIRTRAQAEAEARARDPTPVAAPDFTELLERAKNRKRGADP